MKQVYFGVAEAGTSGFGLYFPDFPGCVTGGETMTELVSNGHGALQAHINLMVEDGDTLPLPSEPDLDAERAQVPEADLRALIAVEVRIPSLPDTVEVPITTKLVQEIDAVTSDRRKFIMEATRRELQRLKASA
ncbi:type II toxin-antitoxin system HicB family antitoxin [Sandaracinobacteroides saxicola]|uniref:Type II toxin-antitoxin system HicB family antitoxin n=1 Tax=Sandaracinobacteroides saxicola TaxID=2759707 RepID=A0A7G5IJV3_9SPHN|nr:type II toxin-antitoxin system HicB family antitoxin [Sandaracinobacteroides saxicola]QMW23645.1 type II toxin-antitoxin system HicB family antitoxin [Sandaracinobacteroides saxicola]